MRGFTSGNYKLSGRCKFGVQIFSQRFISRIYKRTHRSTDQRDAFSECDSGVARPRFSMCKSQSNKVTLRTAPCMRRYSHEENGNREPFIIFAFRSTIGSWARIGQRGGCRSRRSHLIDCRFPAMTCNAYYNEASWHSTEQRKGMGKHRQCPRVNSRPVNGRTMLCQSVVRECRLTDDAYVSPIDSSRETRAFFGFLDPVPYASFPVVCYLCITREKRTGT